MNLTEMAKLLMTASLIDPRLSRKSNEERLAMAQAWLGIVDERCSYEFATECLRKHYQTTGEMFMPVKIMTSFKVELDRKANVEKLRELAPTHPAIPMPDNVRALIRDIGKKPR
jgi:hypothetical protein